MIGAVVFVIVFVLFLLLSLVGIALPPGDMIIREYIPDILQTDYANLAEGIINGVIFGILVWVIFSISKMVYDKMQSPKEVLVKLEDNSRGESLPSSSRIIEIEGIGAAIVMTKFLWQRKKELKINLTRENKIEIQQDSIMELLMDFQKWQIEQLNSEQS